MRIEITIEDQRFHATLGDSAASRDLLAQTSPDRGDERPRGSGEDRTAADGALAGGTTSRCRPGVGDVGYYAPGRDLVLYYGDQSYYEGIVVLGHLEGDAAERIAQMNGDVTVSVDHIR